MPPTSQHPTTPRTSQPPTSKPALDAVRVHLYRDHSASERHRTALPRDSGKRHGRAVAYTDVPTVPPNTINSNQPAPHTNPCSHSTPEPYPHVLIFNAAQHSGKKNP
jgi:hypothetical protein